MLSNLIMFVPFFIVYLLLQYAEKHQELRQRYVHKITFTIYTVIILSYLATVLVSIFVVILQYNENQKETFQFIGLAISASAALLMFIPAIRRAISRSISINPENPVHTVSLSLSFLVFILFIFTAFSLEQLSKTAVEQTSILDLWIQDIALALISFVGVGWLQKRSTRETLARLGLVRPTLRMILTGIGFAVLFILVNLVLEYIAVTTGFGIDPNVDKVTDQLLGPLFQSIPGILTLGFAAALGEELIFRGALLPRFGILYTSLLFTLVHSNYGLSIATIIVFILAISLGILRKRYSTTLTMITHASYNIILGVLALLGSQYS